MKKLLRLFPLVLLTVALLLCMASCGDEKEKEPIEPGVYTLSTTYDMAVKSGFDGTLDEFVKAIRGLAIEFRTSGEYVQWRYQNTEAWYNFVALDTITGPKGDTGSQGLSAYEIFKKYYPDYTGTEEEWILAIVTSNRCALFGHKWDDGVITAPPTVSAAGEKTYTCAVCNETRTEVIPRVIEVAEAELYTVDGVQYIKYGKYPQSHIGDATLIAALNALTDTNALGYYEYEGEEYAKVTAKPNNHGAYTDKYGEKNTYVYSDGAAVQRGVTEWFLVEPIVWRVLSSENGQYQLLADRLLDISVYYHDTYLRRGEDGNDIYPNNYKESDLRAYLNGTFLNKAFTAAQQAAILTTTVDNSASSTAHSSNSYACENTEDLLYALNYKEAFSSGYFADNAARVARATDYAVAIGAGASSAGDYAGVWWLRSPDYDYGNYASYVYSDGSLYYNLNYVTYSYGVRPAFWLDLGA